MPLTLGAKAPNIVYTNTWDHAEGFGLYSVRVTNDVATNFDNEIKWATAPNVLLTGVTLWVDISNLSADEFHTATQSTALATFNTNYYLLVEGVLQLFSIAHNVRYTFDVVSERFVDASWTTE
jgi:hypothetical protein